MYDAVQRRGRGREGHCAIVDQLTVVDVGQTHGLREY
jgi:hypothetical protein